MISSRLRITIMMICVGMNAMLSQIIMTRELMVAFFGNELALGIIFATWLLMVGAGSMAVRPFLAKAKENHLKWSLMFLLAALAIILPILIFTARALMLIFRVPLGEYMAFLPMIASAFITLAPVCLIIGIIFPCACRLAEIENDGAALVYTAESTGSMFAGLLFSFVLVFCLSPFEAALFAALTGMLGAALIAPTGFPKIICRLAAAGLIAIALFPAPLKVLEQKAVDLRWESFGILPRKNIQHSAKTPRLIETKDSRYQNLALVENAGQKALYGNGQVLFAFPDEIVAEQKISFIMAQKPFAKKVLLIGGNPASDIPELLKYPLQSLVQVELDAAINLILRRNTGPDYARALRDKRLQQCLMDGPRFVKQTKEVFDIIIVEAPEPATIALNRFYTVEFYRAISRILAPDGFFYTSIQSSEDLQDETGNLAASVYKALRAVFPRVLASAGTRNQFLADKEKITFDGQTLYERWKQAGVKTKYFRPEYFLNADEISPGKIAFVKQRLLSLATPANTALHPVSSFYNLLLWSRYSGSRIESFLNSLRKLSAANVASGMAAVFVLALIAMIIVKRRSGRKDDGALGATLTLVIAATGFAGMAFELILIFMFQSLLGYIYASIGCLIAMFMLGLAGGAFLIGRFMKKLTTNYTDCTDAKKRLSDSISVIRVIRGKFLLSAQSRWILLLALDAAFVLIGLGLPLAMKAGEIISAGWPVAGIIYFLTLLTGLAGGAQFVLAIDLMNGTPNSEIQNPKSKIGNAHHAALLNAVDLAGAALGSLSICVIFLPLFGFAETCYLLAMLKVCSLLLVSTFLFLHPQK